MAKDGICEHLQVAFEGAKRAVVQVGDGRGFVVEHGGSRFVITAAHCLPYFPPCMSISYLEERTYAELLGPLGGKKTVWAECCFADPVADVAVMGEPDSQALPADAETYDELVCAAAALPVADMPSGPVRLLSLDGEWEKAEVKSFGGPLWINTAPGGIAGGMSGSPILTEDGTAIGVVAASNREGNNGGPCPRLLYHLPGWLLHDFKGEWLRVRAAELRERDIADPYPEAGGV